MNQTITSPKQQGLSLVELMISMVLSLTLALGVYSIYQSNISSYKLQKSLSEIQRNARFSLSIISNTLHSTGYATFFGVLSDNVHNLLSIKNDIRWDPSHPIIGFDNVAQDTTLAGFSGFIVGSDVLIIKQTVNSTAIQRNTNSQSFEVGANAPFTTGDILLATSSYSATLFQASSIQSISSGKLISLSSQSTPGNSESLSLDYSHNADLSNLQSIMYFVKNNAQGKPALYEAVLHNQLNNNQIEANEIASNILNLQLRYGIDSDGDNITDQHLTASAIQNWSQVRTVSVAIIASSSNDYIAAKKTHYIYDQDSHQFNIIPSNSDQASKAIKRPFKTTIDLKNRLL